MSMQHAMPSLALVLAIHQLLHFCLRSGGGSTGARGQSSPPLDGCWPKNRNTRPIKSRFYQSQNAPKLALLRLKLVTCLLVTWAAAADVGLHVDATAYFFPVNDSFSDVIMNEHLKLKTVNGHTVWGGVPSGEGTSPKQAQVANFSPPKY